MQRRFKGTPHERDVATAIERPRQRRQQFVDRLWGRGLLAVLGLYVVGLAIYFVALTVFSTLTGRVEAQAKAISMTYTNSIQLKEMLGVLEQRENLKFAALDCWKAVAETMPAGLTLETLNFNDGRTLNLRGNAPTDQVGAVTDFFLKRTTGFSDAAEEVLDSLTDTFDGTFAIERKSIEDNINTLATRVEELDAILELRRVRLLQQFIQTESILGTLTSQQQALGSIVPISINRSNR